VSSFYSLNFTGADFVFLVLLLLQISILTRYCTFFTPQMEKKEDAFLNLSFGPPNFVHVFVDRLLTEETIHNLQ
jgi:hypothetical protein